MFKKNKKGQVVGGIAQSVIAVAVIVVMAVLVYVFGGAIAGQAYQTVEADLNDITDNTINQSIRTGIQSSFGAYEKSASYLPLFILAILMTVFMVVFSSWGGGGGRGSVL